MDSREPDTDQILEQVEEGNPSARGRLLDRHRKRLRGMVALRMDPRLAARVDPSDIVQESLAEAHRRLDDFLRHRPLPFYPWLRQLALDRLVDMHRRHIKSGKRAVGREAVNRFSLSDRSAHELTRRLISPMSGPSARLRRADDRERLRTALDQLPEIDREVLVLRHLEEMPSREVAAVLGISARAESMRHLRAVERLRQLLGDMGHET